MMIRYYYYLACPPERDYTDEGFYTLVIYQIMESEEFKYPQVNCIGEKGFSEFFMEKCECPVKYIT